MASISGRGPISINDLYTSDTVAQGGFYIGQIADGPDGKVFRYTKAGAVTLVVGNVLQAAAIDTQFDDMAVPAAVATGATGAISLTNGTTVLTGQEFVGGTLVVSVTPGLGEEYTILDNGAAASGAALSVYLDRPIRTAWTTSTKVTLRKSPWNGVIQAPVTTPTNITAGVALFAIPANSYGWIQTSGVAGVLSDATTGAVGSALSTSVTVAGAAGVFVAGTSRSFIGHTMRAVASGKALPVFLNID